MSIFISPTLLAQTPTAADVDLAPVPAAESAQVAEEADATAADSEALSAEPYIEDPDVEAPAPVEADSADAYPEIPPVDSYAEDTDVEVPVPASAGDAEDSDPVTSTPAVSAPIVFDAVAPAPVVPDTEEAEPGGSAPAEVSVQDADTESPGLEDVSPVESANVEGPAPSAARQFSIDSPAEDLDVDPVGGAAREHDPLDAPGGKDGLPAPVNSADTTQVSLQVPAGPPGL